MCTSNLNLYLYNSENCIVMMERVAQCLAKKVKKGISLDFDHLANSSIMGKIMSEAKKEMRKYGESIQPTKEDIKEMRREIAIYIIEEYVPYL